jgi:dihydroorotase
MSKITIRGARIIDPLNKIDGNYNLYVADGKIVACCPQLSDFRADFTIDAKDYILCPGIVDLQANVLSDNICPDYFSLHLHAAVRAGITHLATNAFVENRSLQPLEIMFLKTLSNQAKKAAVYFKGALTHNLALTQMNELMLLKEAGCIGFSNGHRGIPNTLIKRRCYDYCSMLGSKIYIVPEDFYLGQAGCMHEGFTSTRLGLPGIPSLSETLALSQELMMIEEMGLSAHFCQISAARSTALLEKITKRKWTVTSDVAIHQLFFTDKDVRLDNGLYHVRPPFRTESDLKALRQAIKRGDIDAISSDHITCPQQAKKLPFQNSKPGIASWPLLLPFTLKLAKEEDLPLLNAIACITSKPAAIMGIDAGHLSKGMNAHIVIVDPNEKWSFSEDELSQFGTNWELEGRIKYTLVNGEIAYQDSAPCS